MAEILIHVTKVSEARLNPFSLAYVLRKPAPNDILLITPHLNANETKR